VNELAHLITAAAWGLVALAIAAGIPFAWRKVLAYIEAKTQLQLAEAVRRMLGRLTVPNSRTPRTRRQ
jgi:hypothetical protein